MRLAASAREMFPSLCSSLGAIHQTDLYFADRLLNTSERKQLSDAFVDPAIQQCAWVDLGHGLDLGRGLSFVEIALRPGVTDPVGQAFAKAGELLGVAPFEARTGKRFTFTSDADGPELEALVRAVTNGLLHNDIVDEVVYGELISVRFFSDASSPGIDVVPLRRLSADQLLALSASRGLALDLAEMQEIEKYFSSVSRDPTDAEIEMLAQTWSEHCSHKTFRAYITWEDGTVVVPLLKQLRVSTETIAAPWVLSAFVDNAGIVAFDEQFDAAIKVETHNHPSAVEPFGGANTGVGGVIRDVLGVAADPIAVTNILCFGPLDTSADELPTGVLHPRRVRDGVVDGIADYGNKIGLPTVAGAVVHHEGFTANPLVFAGCLGLRPIGLELGGAQPGHRIVALGGATGRDGIRGATFSSLTMDATTGDVAGASVQIGDPIIEKLVADALSEARDQRLFSAITDCGAGGFSSAIGEIAATLGADVDLDAAPLKYAGLAPWEIWLSEAQERMVIAVPPENLVAIQTVCLRHGVSWCDLGSFRSDGQLVVRFAGNVLVDLPGTFLHEGRPQRQMVATRPTAPAPGVSHRDSADVIARAGALLLEMLGHSDVRSNESIVRKFDHEILGATIGRPFIGARADGPSDASVLAPVSSSKGLVLGIGLNCRTGHINARRMAEAVVDEAIRNAVAVGADPDQIALLDNFSWGDPKRREVLGQLVEAVEGCCAAAVAHRSPFVCGKDSLNNEYVTNTGERRSIPPTLVITALGVLPDADRLISSDVKRAGNVLLLVGSLYDGLSDEGLRGSVLDSVLNVDGPGLVAGGDRAAPNRYRELHRLMVEGLVRSCHDISDGGLVVSAAEMAMGGRLGISLNLCELDGDVLDDDVLVGALFSEASGRLLLEVESDVAVIVVRRLEASVVGNVVDAQTLSIASGSRSILNVDIDELLVAWKGHAQ